MEEHRNGEIISHSSQNKKTVRMSVFYLSQWLCILFTLLIPPIVWSDVSHPIDFGEAVCIALNANPRIRSSTAKIDAAQAAITKARGEGLPKLNLEMGISRSNNPLNVFIYKMLQGRATFTDLGLREFAGPASFNVAPKALDDPNYYNNFNTAFILKVPLFAGGKYNAQTQQAKDLLIAAHEGDQDAKSQLIYDLLQAYEGVHSAKALVYAQKQAVTAAKSYLHTSHVLSNQGLAIQSDVLIAESHLKKAETNLALAKALENNQLDTFRVLIGRPNSHLVPGPNIKIKLPSKPLETLTQHAFEDNPQLSQSRAKLHASWESISIAVASNWPQVDLLLRHDWDSPAIGWSKAKSDNTGILQLTWELFSSGVQYGSLQKAAAEYCDSKANLDNVRNNLYLSLVKVFRMIQTTDLQVKSNKIVVKQLKEATRLLALRYEQGFTTLTQLLDGQAKLDIARASQITAEYNAVLSRAQLLMLINALDIVINKPFQERAYKGEA